MIANGGGVVINISSGAARNPAPPDEAPPNRPRFQRGPEYGITKAALDRFSTGVAEELGEHNVAVISIWPGFTLTERMQRRTIPGIDLSTAEPMETTSKAVAFLCKDPMAYTGRVLIAREVCEQNGL
jgi:NAD(P)-dependent dehydrogenase (short-subunit alcohol dehydrogenase family)